MPCIMSWPGKIPENTTTSVPAMTIDILPTVAELIEAPSPERRIDGKNIWPLIAADPGAKNPHEAYLFYYANNELQAVRSGKWKLVAPHRYRSLDGAEGGSGGIPSKYKMLETGWVLYGLETDLPESNNLAESHPEVVKRLQGIMERAWEDLGDSLQGREGENRRTPGKL